MKLNYKRTLLVGFAFFLIQVFWNAYDAIIPLTLTNKFGMSQFWSGVVMAADNILAVFLLPLFGALSDKCRSRHGKRTPFIFIGTIAASVLLIALSFADNAQLKNIQNISAVDDPATLAIIYDAQADTTLQTPEGETFVLSDKFTKEDFCAIRSDGEKGEEDPYTNYVTPARQACAKDATLESPAALISFIALLLGVLISMAIFRSPAVALMPDVTMKPLRSKGNAIINLTGTAGGILAMVLGMVFATSAAKNATMSYTTLFSVLSGIMLVSLGIFMLTVREPQWAKEMRQDSIRYGIEDAEEAQEPSKKLGKAEKRSLIFILLSVALWYFGYNAVTSKFSVYASNLLHKDFNSIMIIAQAAAVVAYIPAGIIASKVGRKKSILVGVIMLATAFGIAGFMRSGSAAWIMYAMFILAGIGWATINVNSFPMVVEMCSDGDVGKYTGYYYTASMAAQTATPMLSGLLMDKLGMTVLFPYATVFSALAFVTMLFVMHGDNKVESKKGLEALAVED